MKLDLKKKELGEKMIKVNHYRKAAPEYIHKKGKGSLNPPHKGRDNEVMEGKNEKELN